MTHTAIQEINRGRYRYGDYHHLFGELTNDPQQFFQYIQLVQLTHPTNYPRRKISNYSKSSLLPHFLVGFVDVGIYMLDLSPHSWLGSSSRPSSSLMKSFRSYAGDTVSISMT
ncbi:hypothetical protein PR048_014813 [Dryococelus australis]|uniref:Maturase K n=1 Tax=Dryococelus australis TaxID=614101 RepID=A0ABQ9HF72_9NEOP|nr:hypothetical protein PR048_014813 [Dryococelus australis]